MIRKIAYYTSLIALTTSSRLAAQAGMGHEFVPLVAAGDTVAACEQTPPAVLQPDEQGFILRFVKQNRIDRAVSAVWDSSGRLRRYTDARGDLRGPPVPLTERGPRTSITIDMRKGMALLLNEDHGQSHGSSMTSAAAALASTALGKPRELLARLHTQCGAPASVP